MIKHRYFPFLGFKTLEDDEKELYDLPLDMDWKALVFEWFSLFILIAGKATHKKEDNVD